MIIFYIVFVRFLFPFKNRFIYLNQIILPSSVYQAD